jgi:hypothetical protein
MRDAMALMSERIEAVEVRAATTAFVAGDLLVKQRLADAKPQVPFGARQK